MADASTQPKRQREETETSFDEEHEDSHHYPSSKHQKTHSQILSILDEDEEELNQEYLTDIFSTLQQELLEQNNVVQENDQLGSCSSSCNEEEECNNDVMRHLLEASDDELGLPNMENDGNYYDGEINSDNNVPLHVNVGLWEIEDEAANYYAILQSELFM